MARKIEVIETKGPVGEQSPPVLQAPDLAEVLAAQARMLQLVSGMADQFMALANRTQTLEEQVAALLEAMVGMRAVIQQIVQMRVL
jgi:hypothetical protein